MDIASATIIAGIIIGIVAAIPGTLSGYASIRAANASIKAANNAAKIAQESVNVSVKTLNQTEAIHVAVNSNLATVTQELRDAIKRIDEFKNIIKDLTDKANQSSGETIERRLNQLEKNSDKKNNSST